MSRPRVLVTGGSGYLGQFLILGLAERFEVLGCGNHRGQKCTLHLMLSFMNDARCYLLMAGALLIWHTKAAGSASRRCCVAGMMAGRREHAMPMPAQLSCFLAIL